MSTISSIEWTETTWNPVTGCDRVIAGGESGPRHRPMDTAWAAQLRDLCQDATVPFFFKQVGGPTPKAGGRLLDGRTWDQYPRVLETAGRRSP